MLFNSLEFLVFFPVVVLLYYLFKPSLRWVLLLVASYYFYMAWRPEYIILIVISTLVDYYCGYKMEDTPDKKQRLPYLVLSMTVNLGLLVFYKYSNFFISVANDLAPLFGGQGSIKYLNIILPMGISFYTFQTMSYTIDVYHNPKEREKHLGIFALYVTFFPQLVAGPIERASHLMGQLKATNNFSYLNASSGMKLIAWGLFKKTVIADRLSPFVDGVFNYPHNYSYITLGLASLFFTFQIYCDFSGYTDIARGTARVMGYNLMLNFNRPYFAKNISDFWRRWHISLSTWFRDYVYIPLGGNRVGTRRLIFNLMLTFVVSGFWHGANWTFIAWGFFHGLILVIESFTRTRRAKSTEKGFFSGIPAWVKANASVLFTFLLVVIGWIFFRANTLSDAKYILAKILKGVFTFQNPGLQSVKLEIARLDYNTASFALCFIFILALMGFERFNSSNNKIVKNIKSRPAPVRYVMYAGLVSIILLFGVFNNSQFIYFQF